MVLLDQARRRKAESKVLVSYTYDASLHEWKTVRTVVANKLITFVSPKSVFKDLQILTVLHSNLVNIENFIDDKIKYVVLNEENCYHSYNTKQKLAILLHSI